MNKLRAAKEWMANTTPEIRAHVQTLMEFSLFSEGTNYREVITELIETLPDHQIQAETSDPLDVAYTIGYNDKAEENSEWKQMAFETFDFDNEQ